MSATSPDEARLAEAREIAKWHCYDNLLNAIIGALAKRDAEIERLRAQSGLPPIKTPIEQALRETVHGQGLSMRAMSDEITALKAELARRRAQPTEDAMEEAQRIVEKFPVQEEFDAKTCLIEEVASAIESARESAAREARAENEYLRTILKDANEELRLIRMKDTHAVYNPALRTQIAIALANAPQPSAPQLSELLPTPEQRHTETDWGPDVGNEIVPGYRRDIPKHGEQEGE